MEERTPTPTAEPSEPRLPVGAQVPLPFDDEAEQPIPFALTARARRTVAPEALPPLRVVPAPGRTGATKQPVEPADDDPSDTRPARARALRRAGVARTTIADQLGVDELLVRAWTADVIAPAHPSRAAVARPLEGRPVVVATEVVMATDRARAAARLDAARRLAAEPTLAAGLGVLSGVADIGTDGLTLTTADPRIAGVAVRWLVEVLEADPSALRVVLRVGPRAAADLARHRWGQAVGLAPDRVRTTRSGAPRSDAEVEGVLRIVDRDLAAAAAGWCDALLEGNGDAGF